MAWQSRSVELTPLAWLMTRSSRGWRGVDMTPRTVAEIERIRRGVGGDAEPPATDEAKEVIAA